MYPASSVLRDALKKEITTFRPNGISHSYQLDQFISRVMGCRVVFFFVQILIEHSLRKQWDSKSDAAFCELCLYCLSTSHQKGARLI